jgi:hypothetical protein
MAVVNHVKREINVKIIYFGSPGCGKGDLFRFIHQRIKPSLCGPLKSMPAGHDTLLFFDYTPFETSSLNGYRIRFHLYTLTGPVMNPGTWKMTLKGADGLALVTCRAGQDDPGESLRVLRSMLTGYGRSLQSLPRIWLPSGSDEISFIDTDVASSFDMGRTVPCSIESGSGILQSLAQLSQEVMQKLREELEPSAEPEPTTAVPNYGLSDELESCRADSPMKVAEHVLSELRLTLAGDSVVRIPLSIQSGSTVRRCVLRLALQLEDDREQVQSTLI